ncbi:MAG: division/cell wall cluster transcriptional repressor MraZ [Anaerovoracaceae bacterium]
MLMGKSQNSIDSKSRLIIPARFRDQLGHKCVLAKGLDKCLYIYPISEWEKLAEKLKAVSFADEAGRHFTRYIFANAIEQEIDRQGRMGIPAEWKEFAEIDKEVITAGCFDKIEIWNVNNYEKDAKIDSSQISKGMKEYGI